MLYGTIVTYFEDKKFGFIRSDSGRDVFFHLSALVDDDSSPRLKVGQPVKYELMTRAEAAAGPSPPRDGKRRAKQVVLIDKIPGGAAEPEDDADLRRHPKSRRKKPTWRR